MLYTTTPQQLLKMEKLIMRLLKIKAVQKFLKKVNEPDIGLYTICLINEVETG